MNYKIINQAEFVLGNAEVAVKGALACIDRASGECVVGQDAVDTLIPVGRFAEDKTGDGSELVKVDLFEQKKLHFFVNDATTPVDVTDTLGPVYVKDGFTVSGDGTGRSVAGRAWIIESSRVGIETADSIGLQGPQGEPGA